MIAPEGVNVVLGSQNTYDKDITDRRVLCDVV